MSPDLSRHRSSPLQLCLWCHWVDKHPSLLATRLGRTVASRAEQPMRHRRLHRSEGAARPAYPCTHARELHPQQEWGHRGWGDLRTPSQYRVHQQHLKRVRRRCRRRRVRAAKYTGPVRRAAHYSNQAHQGSHRSWLHHSCLHRIPKRRREATTRSNSSSAQHPPASGSTGSQCRSAS